MIPKFFLIIFRIKISKFITFVKKLTLYNLI